MLQFKSLEEDLLLVKDYFALSPVKFCDVTIGVRYIWGEDFKVEYAIYNDTLILKESCPDYKNAFYFPMGKDPLGSLEKIEDYALENAIPLRFCCIDNATTVFLTNRYNDVEIYNDRAWSDYIYDAEKFKTFSGKKYSGQRNHINKFKKTYPQYQFKIIEKSDVKDLLAFIVEYEKENDFSMWTAREERKKLADYITNMFGLSQVGAMLKIDSKIVAISIGEVVGDTLYVHVEKGLKKYSGVYPMMANLFAKTFCGDGVKKINREEDCGDMGLRISKLQYQPIEIKEKNVVSVKTLFSNLNPPILIKTERLTITDVNKEDSDEYFALYTDDKLNEFWGYDYREDIKDEPPTPSYFYEFMQSLKDKQQEYSFAIRLKGVMIGELVLHNFDFFGGVEIGFRLTSEHHGKGYAKEGASALMEYTFSFLKVKKLKAKCYKQNAPSKNMLERLGFSQTSADDKYFYFEKRKSNAEKE